MRPPPKHDNLTDWGRTHLASIHPCWWSRCSLISASSETLKTGVDLLEKKFKMDPNVLNFNTNTPNLVHMCGWIQIAYYWAKFGSEKLSTGQGMGGGLFLLTLYVDSARSFITVLCARCNTSKVHLLPTCLTLRRIRDRFLLRTVYAFYSHPRHFYFAPCMAAEYCD